MALLVSLKRLVPDDIAAFPKIAAGGQFSTVESWGYGSGSFVSQGQLIQVAHGSRLLHAAMNLSQLFVSGFEAFTTGDTSVCDGDSGGPATYDLNGTTILGGFLQGSEARLDNSTCTKPGGRQFWIRPGAYLSFIEEILGPCTKTEVGATTLASCQGVPSPQTASAPARDRALEFHRSLIGVTSVDAGGTAPNFGTSSIANTGMIHVGVTTSSGVHDFHVNADQIISEFANMYGSTENGPAPAPHRDAIPWKTRGWSQNLDNRFRITGSQAPEVGRVVTITTLGPNMRVVDVCTGTLIGSRVVRTAAHCLIQANSANSGPVYADTVQFELNRDGATVTKTVNQMFSEWGGTYVGSGCWKPTTYSTHMDTCTWADWAFIVLPADAWSGLGYTPAVMGYAKLTSGDLYRKGSHVGYPICGLVNSPSNCVSGGKYADTDTVSCIVSAFTSGTAKFRSGCDSNMGHSGGPFYDPSTRTLLGHAQAEVCQTCQGATGLDYYAPNYFLGHDDWLIGEENRLRSVYP